MGQDYPDWHPLSTVAAHRDPCDCTEELGKNPEPVVGTVEGAVAYLCDRCGGYLD